MREYLLIVAYLYACKLKKHYNLRYKSNKFQDIPLFLRMGFMIITQISEKQHMCYS